MKQPEALRLADALDELDRQFSRNGLCGDAAAELRRLHEVNQDLLEALHEALETEQEPVALPCVYITSQKDDGNCYGDGTVYRGQRSKDSAVQTYTVQAIEAKLKEKNHE
jgi:hypothetical protein